MSETVPSAFLVDAFSDPVLVRIQGRAAFQNSAGLKDFFSTMIAKGARRFAVDFLSCASMDSTFLGVLAGTALQLRKLSPPGSLTLCRLSARNLELVKNLGLHRLLTVDAAAPANIDKAGQVIENPKARDDVAGARLVLEAHENLVTADSSNQDRFQDVMDFLRNQIEPK